MTRPAHARSPRPPRPLLGALLLLLLPGRPGSAQTLPPPVLDVHVHALAADAQGPPPLAMCIPMPFEAWDPSGPWPAAFLEMAKNPRCDDPIWSPTTDEELRTETLAVMERLNVYGVLGGSAQRVAAWRAAAPGRFLGGLDVTPPTGGPDTDSLRALHAAGRLDVLAEVTNQYAGVAPADERMEPYWALAEELDIPVGIHMGPGPPGATYLGSAGYRASLGRPLLLEEVLVRHPGLRVYLMHAGFPFLDELLALLYAHPQVHVGLGVISFTRPEADFHRYLRAIVEAGFADRVMFGSDQMVWPEAIEVGVERIRSADYLTEAQKRAVLYDNAARFLRLPDAVVRRHHGG